MITHSGILVLPDNDGVPTFADVARSLSRLPRFVGHTNAWWSVAQHSLVCLELARREKHTDPRFLLRVLLHDAHECITGDIPTLWKTPDMRLLQDRLDERFFRAWNLLGLPWHLFREIKQIDGRILGAEAELFAPAAMAHNSIPAADQGSRVAVQHIHATTSAGGRYEFLGAIDTLQAEMVGAT